MVREVVDETLEKVRAELDEAVKEALRAVERVEEETFRELSAISSSGAAARESVRQRIVSLAEISAKNRAISVVENSVNTVFDKALKEIGERATRPDFAPVLKRLLTEAVETLGDADVVAESNEAGLRMLRDLVRDVGDARRVKIQLSDKPIETIAGVRVRTADGFKIYDNTVEARLERLRPYLRKEIASLLMGR
ncbi:MAG: V-type ATP synthase subunit E family protein [Nitrososphaerota archaeon]